MKNTLIFVLLIAALLTACSGSQIHFADPADVREALDASDALAASLADHATEDGQTVHVAKMDNPAEKRAEVPVTQAAPQPTENADAEPESLSELTPITPVAESTPAPTATPAPQEEAQPAPELAPVAVPAYGAIPFELAAGTGTWWSIDSSDSAYWVVQENINAMRAAGGLPALSMDSGLCAIANTRCESFVLGGPFDHSGMTTTSEILAAGPLFSASAVCSAWQASETHYANIMRSDISSMGVACWFCSMDGNQYTYWTVTFA